MAERNESPESLQTVQPEQFFAVDIRAAVITAVEEFPEARRPAYKLRLDLGPLGERAYRADGTVVLLRPDRPVAPGQRVG
jgi:tRNA-binding protein